MSTILVPRREVWTRQPQGIVPANLDFVRAYSWGANGHDCALSAGSIPKGSNAILSGRAGTRLRVTNNNQSSSGAIVPQISKGITCVFVAEKHGKIGTNSDFILGECSTSSGPYNYGFYENSSTGNLLFYIHNGASAVNAAGGSAWVANAGPQVWVATYGDGDNNIRLYLNGVQVGSAGQTGNIQRNTSAHLRLTGWPSTSAPNYSVYLAAVANRRMSPLEVASKFSSVAAAYGSVFKPRKQSAPLYFDLADGTTINASLTTADASGYSASVDAQTNIAASYTVATASGATANVAANITITAELANAAASGYSALVNASQQIAAQLASATASGFTATVDTAGTTTIVATLAEAAASGGLANINAATIITASLASAAASGSTATVGTSFFTPEQLAEILAYVEANMPTAEEIAAAVWAAATRSLTNNSDIAAAVLAAAQVTPIHGDGLTLPQFLALKD